MSSVVVSGDTSGSITISAPAVSGTNTLTLPTATDTLVGKATTDTLTNKTVTAPVLSGSVTGTYTLAGTPTMGASVITSGTTVATTSGTSIDFTGIPSWVKRITVMFNGVSTNGTTVYMIQIGDGTITTSGYTGATSALVDAASVNSGSYSSGFSIRSTVAADVLSGHFVLTTLSSNIWIASGVLGSTGRIANYLAGGTKSLSGTLDRLRLTTAGGTDTFDAGSVNILYE